MTDFLFIFIRLVKTQRAFPQHWLEGYKHNQTVMRLAQKVISDILSKSVKFVTKSDSITCFI
jgi:hypothetical protein